MLKLVQHDKVRTGFTLAEVLITLVIIGVVAALTLPTLMTKYQQHVFANQFKKSLYTISQIVVRARSELGVGKLAQYCTEYTASKGYYNKAECTTVINNQLIKISKSKNAHNISRSNEIIKTYNNQNNLTHFDTVVWGVYWATLLSDGSFLSFYVNGYTLYFAVDLNGYKKPNRLGYDIFLFSINQQNDAVTSVGTSKDISDSDAADYVNKHYANYSYKNVLELTYGSPCNLHSTRISNGLGCSYYALRNKCPYDDTKTYWECLK